MYSVSEIILGQNGKNGGLKVDSLDFLIENFVMVVWAVGILLFSILTVLVPFFVWRISTNIAAIRNIMEEYLYGVSRSSKRERQ